MNPQLLINLEKFKHNAKYLLDLCKKNGVHVTPVTKVFCADSVMVQTLIDVGYTSLGDSRIENIKNYPPNLKETMLLRLPSPSAVEVTVSTSSISLNSEIETIKALGESGINHKIILMIDLGDLREGILYTNEAEIYEAVETILSYNNLEMHGIGTNLTCYGSVIPNSENLGHLCDIAEKIRQKYNIPLPIVSGGNSSSIYMIDKLPKGINHLRLGESIVRGVETAYGKPFEGLEQDVITLTAEIIEIKEKPSLPIGETSINAFGERVEYTDNGIQKRAILAVGRQDMDIDGLTPIDKDINIIGASSDHLIVDITNSKVYSIGERIEFALSYGAILAGFTSKYIDKIYV